MTEVARVLTHVVDAAVLTTTSGLQAVVLTLASVVAASLVRVVSTVVHVVADVVEVDTLVVGTLELIEHADPGLGCTDGHVVLVQTVLAVLKSVTDLVAVDTFPVPALELVGRTRPVTAELWSLVTVVTAVINVVTQIVRSDTQMVGALELLCRAIFPVVSGLAVNLIREVGAVSVPVTPELRLDTVAGLALELSSRTLVFFTAVLVTPISTVVIMVTLPSGRDTPVILTLEL